MRIHDISDIFVVGRPGLIPFYLVENPLGFGYVQMLELPNLAKQPHISVECSRIGP
jgi:hypothetical protein